MPTVYLPLTEDTFDPGVIGDGKGKPLEELLGDVFSSQMVTTPGVNEQLLVFEEALSQYGLHRRGMGAFRWWSGHHEPVRVTRAA